MVSDLSVRGVRDFYPKDFSVLKKIFDAWRNTALSYGFEEFEAPILETLELYKIKSGEEIVNQLYCFKDKSGRDLALRPELTPSLARMVAKVHSQLSKPIKWFSIPRCFRYEKPQKGRLREFFQFNVDIIGQEEGLADLEVISLAIDSLCALGLTENDFVVKINNRNFVSGLFEDSGIDEERIQRLYKIIDASRKLPEDEVTRRIDELRLNNKQYSVVDNYLKIKGFDGLKNFDIENEGKSSLIKLGEYINYAGLAPFCDFDPTIVRGLDYYTGIVFEIYDRSEKLRAICGGGRYDNLLEALSGIKIPACGFGMGDVVLSEVLKEKGLLEPDKRRVDYFVVRVSENELAQMLRLVRALRKKGFVVDYSYSSAGVKKQLSRASRLNARFAIIVGEDELREGMVVEKNLDTGEQKKVPLERILG